MPVGEEAEDVKMKFIIPGEAVPAGRPRVTRTGHVYKPAKSRAYETNAAAYVRAIYREHGGKPVGGAVMLTVDEYRQIPRSWSRGKQDEAEKGLIRPTGRPDIDNVIKAAMDILTKAGIWKDDAQVVSLYASKHYGEPRLEISVTAEEGNEDAEGEN